MTQRDAVIHDPSGLQVIEALAPQVSRYSEAMGDSGFILDSAAFRYARYFADAIEVTPPINAPFVGDLSDWVRIETNAADYYEVHPI